MLRTDYVDDEVDTSVNTRRKYRQIRNDDETISLDDVTVYRVVGSEFTANDINQISEYVNEAHENLAPVEDGATASQGYTYGSMLDVDGALFRAIRAITIGDDLTDGVNISPVSIAELIRKMTASSIKLISASGWSTSTATIGTQEVYTYTLPIAALWVGTINFAASGSLPGTLPTEEERAACASIVGGKADDSTMTLTFYAKSKPSVNFYVAIEGVE